MKEPRRSLYFDIFRDADRLFRCFLSARLFIANNHVCHVFLHSNRTRLAYRSLNWQRFHSGAGFGNRERV